MMRLFVPKNEEVTWETEKSCRCSTYILQLHQYSYYPLEHHGSSKKCRHWTLYSAKFWTPFSVLRSFISSSLTILSKVHSVPLLYPLEDTSPAGSVYPHLFPFPSLYPASSNFVLLIFTIIYSCPIFFQNSWSEITSGHFIFRITSYRYSWFIFKNSASVSCFIAA
jgi:hypothetical protein